MTLPTESTVSCCLFSPDDKSILIANDLCIKIYKRPNSNMILKLDLKCGSSNLGSDISSTDTSPYKNSNSSSNKIKRSTTFSKNIGISNVKKEEVKI
jgi:WD40 repeat protein